MTKETQLCLDVSSYVITIYGGFMHQKSKLDFLVTELTSEVMGIHSTTALSQIKLHPMVSFEGTLGLEKKNNHNIPHRLLPPNT